MDVVERVHIAPLYREHDRVVEPAVQGRADTMHLLEHDRPDRVKPDYYAEVRRDLEDAGIDLERHEVDLYDVYDVLARVTTIVHHHADDDVRVNVATGNEMTAVGTTIACMATGATAYFVHPEEYTADEQPFGRGVKDVQRLPTYPIDGPSEEQVAVLGYLEENRKVNKKELIEFGEHDGLPFIENSRASTDKSKFRVLDSKILDPLLADGYVEIEPVGRQKRIHLTEAGENVLHGFRHLLEDHDVEDEVR